MFPSGIRNVIQLFYDTGIAYSYSFDITEVNNLSTDLTLLKPVATKLNLRPSMFKCAPEEKRPGVHRHRHLQPSPAQGARCLLRRDA